MKIGFDNKKYLKLQSEEIKKRIKKFDKLYLEFGGKLFDDYHAVRVLPGFQYDSKIRMLQELKSDVEIIFCINANDIERHKIRADYGITYDIEIMRLIDRVKGYHIHVNSVVITLYKGQKSADAFIKKLERRGIKTYVHTPTKGYPTDVDTIVSEEGYGANPYIETTKKLVVISAPGPCSGKLATCLSQLYHENKRGINAGYAKFETFPVWNLPLKHPVNIAYEAATADLKDINMIDSFHLEKYGIPSINYNRDLEVFPVLKSILYRILKTDIYSSPTDMGVNSIASCIKDDKLVRTASEEEIIRRYYNSLCDYKTGLVDEDVPKRIKMLINEMNLDETNRDVVKKTLEKSKQENKHVMAIKLPNNKIITGKESDLLTAPAACILNAIKYLAKVPDEMLLLSPSIIEPIIKSQTTIQKHSLHLQEVLIALNICSVTNPIIESCLKQISKLNSCEAHASYIVQNGDSTVIRNLKINLTCEDNFYSDDLYYE